MPPPINPLLTILEPAVTRPKGRPTGPQELPTRAELALERSTRRNPSEFERVEDRLAQQSSQSTATSRRGRGRGGGGGVRGGSMAYTQVENTVGGDGGEPLRALTVTQVAEQEEDLHINAVFERQGGLSGPGRALGRPGRQSGRGRPRGRPRGRRGPAEPRGRGRGGATGRPTSGLHGEQAVWHAFDPINGIFNEL